MCAHMHWHTAKAKEWVLSSSMQLHYQGHNSLPFSCSASLSQSFMIITKSRLGILSLINHYHVSSLNRGSHALNPVDQV